MVHLNDKIGIFLEVWALPRNYIWVSVKFKLRKVDVKDSLAFIV